MCYTLYTQHCNECESAAVAVAMHERRTRVITIIQANSHAVMPYSVFNSDTKSRDQQKGILHTRDTNPNADYTYGYIDTNCTVEHKCTHVRAH